MPIVTDKRIDSVIAKSQPFSRAIMKHVREVVHQACPEVVETIKWGMPFFEYKGPLCMMASFKKHMVFGFWKEAIMKGSKSANKNKTEAMGTLGKITQLADLPSDAILIDLIQEAMELNNLGVKVPNAIKKTHREISMPDDFKETLKSNKKALNVFESFSPSHRKEYLEWIVDAKTPETRSRHIEESIILLSQGKHRNWKYERK